jgi:hypothetical protein
MVKCGRCHQLHAQVSDVRRCYEGSRPPTAQDGPRLAPGKPRQVSSSPAIASAESTPASLSNSSPPVETTPAARNRRSKERSREALLREGLVNEPPVDTPLHKIAGRANRPERYG